MKGDFHVRFCGNAGVKFPCVTRLAVMWDSADIKRKRQSVADSDSATRKKRRNE